MERSGEVSFPRRQVRGGDLFPCPISDLKSFSQKVKKITIIKQCLVPDPGSKRAQNLPLIYTQSD